MLGSIEAGGTKIVCAVAEKENVNEIIDSITIATTTPQENLPQIIAFFGKYTLDALGVGSFGPIDVDTSSETYGYITNTPKLAWKNFNFLGKLKEALDCPIFWTTDVNIAAFGELSYGAAQKYENCIYLTVGTGIGGGVVVNGHILEGKGHPELGHIYVNQKAEDTFAGVCPYHHNCLEGLASGPAIALRTGQKGQELTEDHEVWEIEADYLAQACVSYTLSFSPEKIILGGGVMKQKQLFPLIRKHYQHLLNNYVSVGDLDEFIVPCQLQDQSGIIGGLALADTLIKE
ncbi:ROK family protein [Enterococcus mediterraneensis]|uniref:ROK family protein n=1 Tax=Enterococcus mediterraneensis TaxID=2364791 RepID=UPI000F056465|nr:ROK family protein [Enterococcus mediterraneensis]